MAIKKVRRGGKGFTSGQAALGGVPAGVEVGFGRVDAAALLQHCLLGAELLTDLFDSQLTLFGKAN